MSHYKHIPCVFFTGMFCYVSFLFLNACSVSKNTTTHIDTNPEVPNTHITKIPIDHLKHLVDTRSDVSMWVEIEVGDKSFYFTDSANPGYFEDYMHYIWTQYGCFAFDNRKFTFEEIYYIVMQRRPSHTPQTHGDVVKI